MRILHIHFKNLNSLQGEWTVDLTHPAYVSEGIFAITGPTGSGKSTLLDASAWPSTAPPPAWDGSPKRRTASCPARPESASPK